MKLVPNAHNKDILLRACACLLAGAGISVILGTVTPHFFGWQAVGPAALMLLLAGFVIPYALREPPKQ